MADATKRQMRAARKAVALDLAAHLVRDHGWRKGAARGFDYMVGSHLVNHKNCHWRGFNELAMAAAERQRVEAYSLAVGEAPDGKR